MSQRAAVTVLVQWPKHLNFRICFDDFVGSACERIRATVPGLGLGSDEGRVAAPGRSDLHEK